VVDQGVAEQKDAEDGEALQLLAERPCVHAQGGAAGLHHGFEVIAVAAQQDRQSDEASWPTNPTSAASPSSR
jgi:hypothetical protein